MPLFIYVFILFYIYAFHFFIYFFFHCHFVKLTLELSALHNPLYLCVCFDCTGQSEVLFKEKTSCLIHKNLYRYLRLNCPISFI